jgi:hypothetical protein
MGNFSDWLSKKPATKASWIAALTGIFTLLIILYQTYIFQRQTDILEGQSRIFEDQTKLLSNQIHISAKPFIDLKIKNGDGYDSLLIINLGIYPVQNIRIHQIYFAKIAKHGWYVSKPSKLWDSKNLNQNEKWSINITNHFQFYKEPPIADSFTIEEGFEFLSILISFERAFDGKKYLAVLPGNLVRIDNKLELWPENDDGAFSGPLSRVCYYGTELTFEYLRRRPFFGDYEIYNMDYPFGYVATGCLGQITWTK